MSQLLMAGDSRGMLSYAISLRGSGLINHNMATTMLAIQYSMSKTNGMLDLIKYIPTDYNLGYLSCNKVILCLIVVDTKLMSYYYNNFAIMLVTTYIQKHRN